MFSSLSKDAKMLLEVIKQEQKRYKTIGSEILLLALTKIDAAISFVLDQYGVNEYTVRKEIDKLIILRKEKDEYTYKFIEIMQMASNVKNLEDEKEIFDDHILFALLQTPNTVALDILKRLDVDIDSIIDDLINVYNLGNPSDVENNYLFNLTREIKQGKLDPFIGREELIEKVIRILSKKQKNNPMLIGSAGVGKSALVEGVAKRLIEQNPKINVYRLDLGMIIAGTKYRGDLEERFLAVLEKIKNPNSIVFIDEIHNIVGSGSSEGTLDIANILKPILSRNEIKCIGATTLDEYYRYIAKDKALSRRFQNIFIEEASEYETFLILDGISHCYEEFHNVKYSKEVLRYIIRASQFLVNRKLPDKAIDILDEAALLARLAKRKRVEKLDVDRIVFENLGINVNNIKTSLDKIKNFPHLKKYYQLYFMNLRIRNTILTIQTTIKNLDLLAEDFKQIFNLEQEQILNLDLSSYSNHYTSSLIGSPAGYVGYNDGGILTEHVLKFPIVVVVIKNYNKAGENVKAQIEAILESGKIIDAKGRLINFNNTIFIFITDDVDKEIGFIKSGKTKINKVIDKIDELLYETPRSHYYLNLTKEITNRLKDYKYFIDIDCEDMGLDTYKQVLAVLSDLDNFEKEKKYLLKCETNKVEIKNI